MLTPAAPDLSAHTAHLDHQKTHLDVLPPELITTIIALLHTSHNRFTQSELVPFRTAWPNSRYARLSEPHLHGHVSYDCRSSTLAHILARIVARPETRFWPRHLDVPDWTWFDEWDGNYWQLGNQPQKTGNQTAGADQVAEQDADWEVTGIRRALAYIFPRDEAERMGAPSFLTPVAGVPFGPADRVRVLVCLFPNLTILGLSAMGLHGWATGTTAAAGGESAASPGPSPETLPPVPVLRNVDLVSMYMHQDNAEHAWQPRDLLWAFFLPKVRVLGWQQGAPGPVVLAEPAWRRHGASGVQDLDLMKCALREAELEGLLRLPRALRKFALHWYVVGDDLVVDSPPAFSVGAVGRGLSTHQGSLEVLKLMVEYRYVRGERKKERLGSLRGFTKLRKVEVAYWMLAGPVCGGRDRYMAGLEGPGVQRVEDAEEGLSGLPPGLQTLSLALEECTVCENGVCKYFWGHVERLFECWGELVPLLRTLKVAVHWNGLAMSSGTHTARLERELEEMAEEKGAKLKVKVGGLNSWDLHGAV